MAKPSPDLPRDRLITHSAAAAIDRARTTEALVVLVVVYRPRLSEIVSALNAVLQATLDGTRARVVLWHNDDGPAASPGLQETIAAVQAAGLAVKVTGGRGNLGFGRAINAELSQIEEPFVLLLNQDAIPEPGAIPTLLREVESDAPEVAAWEMRQIPYEHPKDYDPVTGDTVWFSGAAVLLRTAALRAVGGFEPRFFMYCEDVDLSWRLRCAGWRLRYRPRCAVVHNTYSEPGEVKPLAALQGFYANLCLRARFAGRRHVIDGVRGVLQHVRAPEAFPGHRLGLLKALARFCRNYAYFRRTRMASPGFEPCFRGWDYEMRREGPFIPYEAQADRDSKVVPVSVLLRAHGEPQALNDCLTCLAGQTHAPHEVIVIGGTQAALTAVCDSWESCLDLRRLPPMPVPLDEVAEVHARHDWWITLEDEGLLPYADHVELLLTEALCHGTPGAVAWTWHVDAGEAARHEAHLRHAPRTIEPGDGDRGGARLVHRRRGEPQGGAAALTVVPKVTTVRYQRNTR